MKIIRGTLNVWLTGVIAWSVLTLWHLPVKPWPMLTVLAGISLLALSTCQWPAGTLVVAITALTVFYGLMYFGVLVETRLWLDQLHLDATASVANWRANDPAVPEGKFALVLLGIGAYCYSVLLWLSSGSSRRTLTAAVLGALILSAEWLFHHDGAATAAAIFLPAVLLQMAATRATELGTVFLPKQVRPESPRRPYRPLIAISLLAAILVTGIGSVLPAHFATADLGIWRDSLQRHIPLLADLRGTTLRRIALGFDLQQLGYGGSSDELGGPVATSDATALHITVQGQDLPASVYLRGRAPVYYSGRGWIPGSEEPVRRGANAPSGDASAAASQTTMFAEIEPASLRTRTLFTVLEPVFMQATGEVAWLEDLTAVGTVAPGAGDAYHLTVRLPLYSEDEIYRLTETFAPDAVPVEYVSIPVTLPARVKSLAAELVAPHNHPYDQAIAIEQYVRQFSYDLNAPRPPAGTDFVDHFLFEHQAGYCTYHASAMTVMLRSIGIPARFVTGFRVDINGQPGTYDVANRMAHAWVEAFLPGYGWMTFEPTPAFAVPSRDFERPEPAVATNDQADTVRPSPVLPGSFGEDFLDPAEREPGPSGGDGSGHSRTAIAVIPAALAGLVLLAAAGWIGLSLLAERSPRVADPAASVTVFTLATRLFTRSGLRTNPGLTATEQIHSAVRRWPTLTAPLLTMLAAYLPSRYGLTNQDTPGAVSAWHQVRRGVRAYQGWFRYAWRLLRQQWRLLWFKQPPGAGPSAT